MPITAKYGYDYLTVTRGACPTVYQHNITGLNTCMDGQVQDSFNLLISDAMCITPVDHCSILCILCTKMEMVKLTYLYKNLPTQHSMKIHPMVSS